MADFLQQPVRATFDRTDLLRGNVTIAMDDALRFGETREPLDRQRHQCGAFVLLEEFGDLLARRAMNAGVGDGCLPVEQVIVLLLQAAELMAFQRVLLNVIDTPFHLAFVARCPWFRRQQHGSIVLTETTQLGIQIGIVPVGFQNGRFEVVAPPASSARPRNARTRFPNSE